MASRSRSRIRAPSARQVRAVAAAFAECSLAVGIEKAGVAKKSSPAIADDLAGDVEVHLAVTAREREVPGRRLGVHALYAAAAQRLEDALVHEAPRHGPTLVARVDAE